MEGISYTLPIVHSRLRGFFATRRAATRNAGIGALLTLGVMAAYLAGWPLFEGLELRLYDMRCKLRANLATADEIVLVAIDENSQVQLGSWPWPRWRLAGLIDKLSAAGAKVVGLDVPLSETEYSPGLAEIQHLRERYDGLLAARAVTDRKKAFAVEFSSSISQLDSDARLEESMRRAGNVVLPVLFKPRGKLAAGSDAPPLSVSSHALFCSGVGHAAGTTSAPGLTAVYPLARFASASVGLGHIQEASDFDGVLRWEMPVLRYGDAVYASFPMELVLAHGGFGDIGAQWIPGRFLRIGGHDIPTDSRGRMLITYNGPEQTFQYFSFADVMNDKTPKDAFKGKIVIVGLAASGLGSTFITPVAGNLPAIEVYANVIENILHRNYIRRPPWAAELELALLLAMGLFVMFGLSRLRAPAGLAVCLLLAVGTTAAGIYLFFKGEWIKVAYPAILLGLGYIVVVFRRGFARARRRGTAPPGGGVGSQGVAGSSRQTIGRYEITKEIGPGDCGTVYLGRDPGTGQAVVIRALALGTVGEEAPVQGAKELFFREAAAAAALCHPNIARVFDAGEESRVAYIATELLDGHDFTRYTLKEGLLPWAQALEHMAVVAEALDYVHSHGLVHRHVEPARIMLLADGTIRVTDFGMAALTALARTMAAAGTAPGAPSYMSPEQAAGRKVDGRSDLFSLTVVLFELLTGQKPFPGGDGDGVLLFQIANEPHPDPRAIRPDLPEGVIPILNRGLAKDPDDRYGRGSLLAADLRAVASAAADVAAPASEA